MTPRYEVLSNVGAVREHWRLAIRQKLTKSRAQERKAMEEKRRIDNEEETDEEEMELTGTDFDNDIIMVSIYSNLETHVECRYACMQSFDR